MICILKIAKIITICLIEKYTKNSKKTVKKIVFF